MTLHHGDCLDVMAGMEPESVDAIVTDPPYGLEFMGKAWDRLDGPQWGQNERRWEDRPKGGTDPFAAPRPRFGREPAGMQAFHARWAEAAYRVARPSSYLLAFGGTRTVHRMTCALEDAGWIIRDMLVWGYASGFPKSKASLKPAWEPIVMARKPGPLRMLAIDECRIGYASDADATNASVSTVRTEAGVNKILGKGLVKPGPVEFDAATTGGRWPANIVLTDEVFGDEYSRFFLVPKAARSDREPVLKPDYEARRETAHRRTGPMDTPFLRGETMRLNPHPTVKPVDLMRHLVRLVTPTGGTVLDPFLGSGTTAIAAEMEGFAWIGIEREAEYVAIAEARLNGTQRGLGLPA